jgi:hypothetical protein
MNTNTRPTLKSTNARIDSLESKLDLILARLEPSAPAKVTRKADLAAQIAHKPTASGARKVLKARGQAAPKALCKATRKAFIAAAAKEGTDFGSWSTKAIAAACVEDPSLVPSGFRIGEGYAALYA